MVQSQGVQGTQVSANLSNTDPESVLALFNESTNNAVKLTNSLHSLNEKVISARSVWEQCENEMDTMVSGFIISTDWSKYGSSLSNGFPSERLINAVVTAHFEGDEQYVAKRDERDEAANNFMRAKVAYEQALNRLSISKRQMEFASANTIRIARTNSIGG